MMMNEGLSISMKQRERIYANKKVNRLGSWTFFFAILTVSGTLGGVLGSNFSQCILKQNGLLQ